MNNLKKLIIKFIVLVILISSSLLFMTGKVNAAATRSYNFNATNILDNLSKDPTFGLLIPIISSDCDQASEEVISATKVKSDFKAKGLTVKKISTGNKIATGTTITVNENANIYTILIYGDLNCDGIIDAGDISAMISNNIEKKKLFGIQLRAGDLLAQNFSTTEYRELDAELSIIIPFTVGKSTVPRICKRTPVLYNPDTTKPVITLTKTSETISLNGTIGDLKNYIKSVTDDTDGNIDKSKVVITSSLNTSKVGKYEIKYDVTDSAGNKADTKKLTVNVVNDVKDIKLEGLANVKTKYKLNDTSLDTTNLVVKLVRADSSEEVTNDYQISGFNTSSVGEKTITVTHNNKFSKTFKINVYDPSVVVSINVDTIGENELRMDRPISKAITFKNEFNENVNVTKGNITITSSDTVNVEKNKNANSQADDIEAVTYLRLIPQSVGNYTITIKVGSVTKTISGSVVAAGKITSVTYTKSKVNDTVYIVLTAKNQYGETMDITDGDIGEARNYTEGRIRIYSEKESFMGIDSFDISNDFSNEINGIKYYSRSVVVIKPALSELGVTLTDEDKIVYIEVQDVNDVWQKTVVSLSDSF